MRDFAVLLYLLRLTLAAAVGVFGGWWLTLGFCSRWLLGVTVLCGHNAFIPLFLLVPIAGGLGWFILAPVTWAAKRAKPAESPQDAA
jgi:hypothetical protein